jgi:DNA-binding MarR family transcriptional regulator
MTQHNSGLSVINSEIQTLINSILSVSSWLDNELNKHYSKHGLTNPQCNVMRILYSNLPHPLSVGIVQSKMLDKSSNVTRLVLKLREKGLVVQTPNATNRRIQEIRITEQGTTLLKKLESDNQQLIKNLVKLDRSEVLQLIELINKLKS